MSRSVKKVQLPKEFAQKLLDYQIQYKLSDRPTKQVLKNLVEMYAIGVEYYQSIRSHKYLYFQLKMQQLFTASANLNAANEQKDQNTESPLKKKLRSAHEEQKIQAIQIKHKQEKMLQQMASNTNSDATASTVKQILNENDLKNKITNEKLNQQLQNQDQKLKQKILKRKSRLLFSKSFSSTGMGQNDTQDTLFSQNQDETTVENQMKPIEVCFGNVIHQNQSDDDQTIKISQKGEIKLLNLKASQTKTKK